MEHLKKIDLTDNFSEVKKKMINLFNTDNDYIYVVLSLTIVFLILFALLSWITSVLSLKQKSCRKLNSSYPDNSNDFITKTFIKGRVTMNPLLNKYVNHAHYNNSTNIAFRNFYVKASYNSCCADGYKNNWVDLCALRKFIKLGVRFVDFEIYAHNNIPSVAASTLRNYNIKETYNSIKLYEVFNTLNQKAFDENFTESYNDPMIIHLRLMTQLVSIYDNIANLIKNNLIRTNTYKLPNTLTIGDSNYDPKNDLLKEDLKIFAKKFIIIVHDPANILLESTLKNYVNMKSGTNYCQLFTYNNMISAGKESQIIIAETKQNYTIVLPNNDNTLDNYDHTIPHSNGCQIMAMKFQNIDQELINYNNIFSGTTGGGFNFIKKPPGLLPSIPAAENLAQTSPIVSLNNGGLSGIITITNNYSTRIRYKLYKQKPMNNDIAIIPIKENIVNKNTISAPASDIIRIDSTNTGPTFYIKIIDDTNNELRDGSIIIAANKGTTATESYGNPRNLLYDNDSYSYIITPKRGDILDIELEIR